MYCTACLLQDVLIRTIGVVSSNCRLSRAGPNVGIYIELQGLCIRGNLIVYIVVPRVIYAKSRQGR